MKIIKLSETHYIVVDDSIIKAGDWYLANQIEQCGSKEEANDLTDNCKRITHSTQPLETLDYDRIKPLSLKQVEEAIYGYSVKTMAEDYTEKWCGKRKVDIYIHDAFEAGFYAHKEISDKLFSKADIMNLILEYEQSDSKLSLQKYFLQSLQPKTEWECTIDNDGKITLI